MKVVLLYLILIVWVNAQAVEVGGNYTLSIEYACRNGVYFASCQGNVIWNDQILTTILPNDYRKKTLSWVVTPIPDKINILSVMGTGASDSYGLTIDNVRLIKLGQGHPNVVVNGDFESSGLTRDWTIASQAKGWYTKAM